MSEETFNGDISGRDTSSSLQYMKTIELSDEELYDLDIVLCRTDDESYISIKNKIKEALGRYRMIINLLDISDASSSLQYMKTIELSDEELYDLDIVLCRTDDESYISIKNKIREEVGG